ncbi:LYR motif containing protein 1 isoform X1 [Archocentrus centrarchus]|uniref:LYR motif containing protein 1 isoform X1 n=1 Tax=Archocentrus centrarchus TaxID=63155 RepID=UPI0011EA3585|nr:LYR motif-containing protein 1 isoform X1 [Archocentrus centrarchus]
MTASTRTTVLSLYMRVFRIARNWQAQSGVLSDTETERKYILQEARTLFRQNQKLTEQESIKRCIEECEARIEIGKNGEKLRVFFAYGCAEIKPLQVCITETRTQGLRIYHRLDWQLRRAGSCEHSSA